MIDNVAIDLTLKKIFWLAQEIQSEIKQFQPDLLLVLARGGLAPLWALQALWQVKQYDNSTPIVITNLGREKLVRFEYHRERIGVSHMPEIEPFDFYNEGERGYFLAWLGQQSDWRAELRQQIEASLGSRRDPARILVIDDTVHRRWTTLLTLGLLLAEYPAAETRMMAANIPDWRWDLSTPWLAQNTYGKTHATEREIKICLFEFAAGASDIKPDSLFWQPLTPESNVMQKFVKYLPAERWLGLSVWLEGYIKEFVRQYSQRPEEKLTAGELFKKKRNIQRPYLEPKELIYRNQWLSAEISPEEASDHLGCGVEDAKRLLGEFAKRDEITQN